MDGRLAIQLGQQLLERGWMLALAESCTGGGIAAAITDIAGSSAYFDRGFVTYSNEAKQQLLGVPADLITRFGAVSQECAAAMAEGALLRSDAQIALSVTGIAGPDGGSAEKPVGTVWFGLAVEGKPVITELQSFKGDRATVRELAVEFALQRLAQAT